MLVKVLVLISCISFDSYIKPQRLATPFKSFIVVYLLIPTSNHNFEPYLLYIADVVYLLIPTSNHNLGTVGVGCCWVVYLLIPTSNHN